MNHKKTYQEKILSTSVGEIVLAGPISSEKLSELDFHKKLEAFRPSEKQKKALMGIADLDEGRIIAGIVNDEIVGYVTFLHPDPLERWSAFNMHNLIELGAIEIAPEFRGIGLGSSLIKLAIDDPFMENYIIFSTEYYWHWDLKDTKLSVWNYRKIMEKMMFAGGLTPAPTNDPEIMSHPANCLMVRIGKNVPKKDIEKFDELRFLDESKHSPFI